MMKRLTILCLVLLIGVAIYLLSFRRSNFSKSIGITGFVFDSSGNRPIAGAEILLVKWYKTGVDDVSYKKYKALTDANGKYKFNISDFDYVQIGVKSKGYYPEKLFLDSASDFSEAREVYLKKCIPNPDLTVIFDRNKSEELKLYPRLKIRFYYKDDKLIKKESIGYSFSTKSLTSNLSAADVWIDSSAESFESMIFRTKENNEVCVINTSAIKTDGFAEYTKLPVSGYTTSRTILKGDKVFFIRCGSSLNAKMIKLPLESENMIPNRSKDKLRDYDYIKELELSFHVLILGNAQTNFKYCDDTDLEDYLINIEYK